MRQSDPSMTPLEATEHSSISRSGGGRPRFACCFTPRFRKAFVRICSCLFEQISCRRPTTVRSRPCYARAVLRALGNGYFQLDPRSGGSASTT